MKELMEPLRTVIDWHQGVAQPDRVLVRRASDMKGLYADEAALERLIEGDDPTIYEVKEIAVPEEAGQILYSTTTLYPGTVGREYFMTKGHFHAKEDTAEAYFCLEGEGYLLLQTKEGRTRSIHMTPGVLGYIPPYWGHRTMNTGSAQFVFLCLFLGDAGHDYQIIADRGFAKIMVQGGAGPTLDDNPRYRGPRDEG